MSKYLPLLYTQERGFLNHIEGLRALAGIVVILFHMALFSLLITQNSPKSASYLPTPIIRGLMAGSLSLDAFFFITGFLVGFAMLSRSLKHGQVDVGNFMVKRVARVYPMYLFVMIVFLPFSFKNAHNAWANLLQVNNLLPMPDQYLLWTWSLAIDFHAYAFFSLLFWLVNKKIFELRRLFSINLAVVLISMIICVAKVYHQNIDHLPLNYQSLFTHEYHQYFDSFFDNTLMRFGPIAIGFCTAYLLTKSRSQVHDWLNNRSKFTLTCFCLLFISLMGVIYINDPIFSIDQNHPTWQTSIFWTIFGMRNGFALALAGLVVLLDQPRDVLARLLLTVLSSRLLRPFGQLTFSAYLIHPPILLFGGLFYVTAYPDSTSMGYVQNGVFLTALSYLMAVPCYLFIEQPAMQAIKRKWLKPTLRHNVAKNQELA